MRVTPSRASTIRTARAEDVPSLARLLARAFDDDPLHRWVLPKPRGARRSERLFALVLRQSLDHGLVETTDALDGATVWSVPESRTPPAWRRLGLAIRYAWLVGRRASLVQEGFERLERQHPEEPHWHLSILGTEPRGQGVGSALLRSALERCDDEGKPAYLECSKAANLRFYARQGFHVVDELDLPQGPTIWPMLRKPL